jgi:hypothetical protein
MEINCVDCPKCGSIISEQIMKGKLFKCNNCGSTLVWPDNQEKIILSFGMIICPNCGVDNEQNRYFCKNCGNKLTKSCPSCNDIFYVGDNFCPNGHEYEKSQQELEDRNRGVTYFLDKANNLAINDDLEQAAQILEYAINVDSGWSSKIAGIPVQTLYSQLVPASGYGLLTHLAGKNGQKHLSVHFVKRMLELRTDFVGVEYAQQAAREAEVWNEAKEIAKVMRVSWGLWG